MVRHILEALDLSANEIERIIVRASRMEHRFYKDLEGTAVAFIFFEPSTRTRLFELAVKRLGGVTVVFDNAAHSSSANKGEDLNDTLRVLSGQADCIVLRHPDEAIMREAVQYSHVPVINAGDGSHEHPTQGLIDLFTLWEAIHPTQKGPARIPKKKLRVLFWGDNAASRTVRSFASLLAVRGPELGIELEHVGFFGPEPFGAPPADVMEVVRRGCASIEVYPTVPSLTDFDVVYSTRTQKERHDEVGYIEVPLTLELAETLPKHAIIMNPMPRVGILPRELDTDDRTWYFKQSDNGMLVRMALIRHLALNKHLGNGK